MNKKPRQFRAFRDFHIEELKDTENARIYLEIARKEHKKDHDRKAFLKAIEDVAEAQGGLRDTRVEDNIDLEHRGGNTPPVSCWTICLNQHDRSSGMEI